MIDLENLRRLEAEEIQERVARHLCKLMDDEWKLGRKLYMDTAKEILDDIALPELLKALEWQPIETAPTGVEIMVGGIIDGTWECSVYRIKDEYWREEWCDEPTHWMPLPLPPHGGGDVG